MVASGDQSDGETGKLSSGVTTCGTSYDSIRILCMKITRMRTTRMRMTSEDGRVRSGYRLVSC